MKLLVTQLINVKRPNDSHVLQSSSPICNRRNLKLMRIKEMHVMRCRHVLRLYGPVISVTNLMAVFCLIPGLSLNFKTIEIKVEFLTPFFEKISKKK